MRKNSIYFNYFKRTAPIWILFIICIYCVFACSFETLRLDLFRINKDIVFVNKINDIIKNLSFSYIAGAIFFFLSDTIPFLRRKKLINKIVQKLLSQMVDALDDFSLSINNCKWNKDTKLEQVFEEFSGGEYSQNMPQTRLTSDKIILIDNLSKKINLGIDYVLSQEIYIDTDLVKEMDRIKINDIYILICSISNSVNNEYYLAANKVLEIFKLIIDIKTTLLKHM